MDPKPPNAHACMLLSSLKHRLISDRVRPVRILLGPFRGATICLSPRDSLRKVFGLYEHELNDWLSRALPKVDTVLDVGANDGYFTFGCAAAFRRRGKTGHIIAFEPEPLHCEQLRSSVELQLNRGKDINVTIEETFVGKEVSTGQTTLDALVQRGEGAVLPRQALIKIDVEGAEMDVIEGAAQWLDPSNYFLIEVHQESYLEKLRDRFESAGLTLDLIRQRPLRFLGQEQRQSSNCWLVTAL